jgi:hypothetical protein
MKKNYYVVTCPENGWDCVIGIYLATSEEEVYENLCEERYGGNYTESDLESTKDMYIVTGKIVTEFFSKAEIREQKIEQILKQG